MDSLSKIDDKRWIRAPVIVGGTGGSGTRGVVDMLDKLGIYMHPGKHTSLFEECYNGEAMDNVAMFPISGGLEGSDDTGKIANSRYIDWLTSETCIPRKEISPFVTKGSALRYLDSVPSANRLPHRWGWKNPKTIYHLEVLLHLYPDLIFIQVVRNPFDMASVQFEHLNNRVQEFSFLHDGYDKAADLSNLRCLKISPENPKACLLTAAALKTLSECNKLKGGAAACAKKSDISALTSPWRCLEMQLWAHINSASYIFGVRCLNPDNRYLVWHGEDVYGHRGEKAQLQLAQRISDVLDIPIFEVTQKFVKANQRRGRRRRRLGYGKYMDPNSHMNLTRNFLCAESAVPGAMEAFDYKNDAELAAFSSKDHAYNSLPTTSVRSSKAKHNQGDKFNDVNEFNVDNILLILSSLMLLLLWCRRKRFASPDLNTIDLLTS